MNSTRLTALIIAVPEVESLVGDFRARHDRGDFTGWTNADGNTPDQSCR
jgi:hypothetical protein